MRNFLVRTALFAVGGTLLAAFLSGCTLTGADPAPLTTPVGGNDTGSLPVTSEATQMLPPTPTPIGPIDVFATQTAQASVIVVTQQPIGTDEPGGEVTQEPTAGFTTPTPQVQAT